MPKPAPVLVIERRTIGGAGFMRRQSRIREAIENDPTPTEPAPEGATPADWTDDQEQF